LILIKVVLDNDSRINETPKLVLHYSKNIKVTM
jgi:hypothetical protein